MLNFSRLKIMSKSCYWLWYVFLNMSVTITRDFQYYSHQKGLGFFIRSQVFCRGLLTVLKKASIRGVFRTQSDIYDGFFFSVRNFFSDFNRWTILISHEWCTFFFSQWVLGLLSLKFKNYRFIYIDMCMWSLESICLEIFCENLSIPVKVELASDFYLLAHIAIYLQFLLVETIVHSFSFPMIDLPRTV